MLSVVENLFSDNRKIGVILVSLGVTLLVLGVILFFDSALLAMGNILFLGGMPFLFGFMRCLHFFNPFENPSKWKGLICFFSGIVLVLMRWTIIGMIMEGYGIIVLFGSYFPMLLSFLRQVPIIGKYVDGIPYLKDFAASAAKQAPKYPAV
ncbi:hypothetical protein JH06_1123 [Blastocystis sp. subtype 4]|uniref:hypothetical protein n=1 Tax=Blastocystis sp. subtype 4 TaxID=944170 RepID=UPI0007118D3C|nr:hypothetical protein JH06_1123 [Blastocystis sp. subtype 4]KNB45818.1 hypothetical protein JH06_1123 [Blastocystis sp. subtype 4]|eukprot:XP_014529261.1 hypothetical protein JH06_1123 [Blastocystis sp. subtype 4]